MGWVYIVDFEWQPKEYSAFYFLYETLIPMVFDVGSMQERMLHMSSLSGVSSGCISQFLLLDK